MKSKDLRELAISHYENGKKAPEIAKLLANKAHRSTIFRWIDRYQQSGSLNAIRQTGRPRSKRTKRLVNSVKNRLKSKSLRKSSRTMAKDFNVSNSTIILVLKEDLSKYPYKKIRVPKLTSAHKAKRKSNCTWMRKNLNREKVQTTMYTDEKIFTTNGYFNPKNDIVWADDRQSANEEGGVFEEEKYPINVMVALGVTWNGLTQPFFFDQGERLNAEKYIDVLKFYKREGNRLFNSDDWTFQQDGASSHTSNLAQNFCKNHFKSFIPKEKWPPNSPELNPMDYSVWNEISKNVDYKKVTNRENLISEIEKAIKKIDQNFTREVIGTFLSRVYSIEKNNGDIIINNHS